MGRQESAQRAARHRFMLLALLLTYVWHAPAVAESKANLVVKGAVLTKEHVPVGETELSFALLPTMELILPDAELEKAFGRPTDKTKPKDGTQFVILDVEIAAKTVEQWAETVRSLHLLSKDGSKEKVAFWFFNGAYRVPALLSVAKSSVLKGKTRLICNEPDPLPEGLKVMVGEKEIGPLLSFIAKNTSLEPLQFAQTTNTGASVFAVLRRTHLKQSPEVLGNDMGEGLSFGTELRVQRVQGDWLQVGDPQSNTGWIHRAMVCGDKGQIERMRELDIIPEDILLLQGKPGADLQCTILGSGVRVGNKRLLMDHGSCVMFDNGLVQDGGEFPMGGFGVEQTISNPLPWTLYFYCSDDKVFRSVPKILSEGKKIATGAPLSSEPVVIPVIEEPKGLPQFAKELQGNNPVRIKNPNDFSVKVGLRSGKRGKDFWVPENGQETVHVPDGDYKVYFVYSAKPDALFQGDDFKLRGNGVEIQIVKVADGNYGIRQVK